MGRRGGSSVDRVTSPPAGASPGTPPLRASEALPRGGDRFARGASLGGRAGTGGASASPGAGRRATATSARHGPSGAKASPVGRPGRRQGRAHGSRTPPSRPARPGRAARMTTKAAVKRREARRLAWGSFQPGTDRATWKTGCLIRATTRMLDPGDQRTPREPAGFGIEVRSRGVTAGPGGAFASAPDGASPLALPHGSAGNRDGQTPAGEARDGEAWAEGWNGEGKHDRACPLSVPRSFSLVGEGGAVRRR